MSKKLKKGRLKLNYDSIADQNCNISNMKMTERTIKITSTTNYVLKAQATRFLVFFRFTWQSCW